MAAGSSLADKVRNVRGVFGFSMTFRFVFGAIMILFAFVLPSFFAYVIYSSHVPLNSWNADIWATSVLIPASLVIGCVIFWAMRTRWEFTDTEIVALRAGGVAWRLAYAEIAAVEIRTPAPWMRVLWLQSAKGKYSVLLSDAQLVRSVEAPVI